MADRFAVPSVNLVEGAPITEGTKKKLERSKILRERLSKAQQIHQQQLKTAKTALKLRTHQYEREYKKARAEITSLKRQARKTGGFYREPDAKVLFCMRIKGINKLAPKPKMILRLFRLRQLHNGVFIKVNNATREMLKAIEPFVVYGYPSLQTIRKLIYGRGYAKVGPKGARQRVRLQNNDNIHRELGKYGIHGIEDLIHEIYTCGPNFKQATNFLWPFKLRSPRKGFVCKRHGFQEPRGGDWGNREELVNELVGRMC